MHNTFVKMLEDWDKDYQPLSAGDRATHCRTEHRTQCYRYLRDQALPKKERKRRSELPLAPHADGASYRFEQDAVNWEAITQTLDDCEMSELLSAIGCTSPQQQVILWWHGLHGVPQKQVAELLGLHPGTINAQMHRARAKLLAWAIEYRNPAA